MRDVIETLFIDHCLLCVVMCSVSYVALCEDDILYGMNITGTDLYSVLCAPMNDVYTCVSFVYTCV